jgi:parallel beta-helix repeat protein
MLKGRKQNMKNSWLRKCMILGTIIVLVGTSVVSAMSRNVSIDSKLLNRGNTLYVGGSGPGNYSKIQDAIKNSSDGDIVFVYSDSSPYIENIKVYSEIKLIGEDKNSTEIKGLDPNDEVIAITTADFVTISGFTISNGNKNNVPMVQIYSSYNSISGNIFEDNESIFKTYDIGVAVTSSSHACMINDNIFQNTSKGINIGGSSLNEIYNNSFFSNDFGIIINGGMTNTISNNTFIDGYWGISISHCNSSKVVDNVLISYQYEGIEIYSHCSKNKILRNNISLCGDGISVDFLCDNNKVQNNSLQQNICGILVGYLCDYNVLENNKIIDNQQYGIGVLGSYNKIRFNVIKDNEEVGILISGENNDISYNTIENNGKGVYLQQDSNYNMITFNNFINNNGFFMYSFKDRWSKNNVWDNNYWDSLNGNVKIIVGRLKILLYTWTDWFSRQTYEIALYPKRFNFDMHPAQEPYDIPRMS